MTEPVTPTYRGRLQKDLVRGSLWTLAAAVAFAPLAFAVNLVLAHRLGPSGLGTLATLTAAFGLSGAVLNLGTSEATVQWLAEARAHDRPDHELDLVARCVGYHAFAEGPLLAIAVVALLHDQGLVLCLVAAAAAWAAQIVGTASVVLTATARNAAAARLAFVATVVAQATTVAVAFGTRSPHAVFVGQVAAGALAPLLCFVVLSRQQQRAFLRPRLGGRGAPAGFRRYALSACAASLVTTLVFGRSELFVLQANGLRVAAGLFALTTSLAGQITIPMDALMGPLLPTAAGLMAAAPERAVAALGRSLRVSALLGAVTAAVAVPAVVTVMPAVYGSRFDAARGAVFVLCLVSCLQSVIVPVQTFALATRSAAAVLRANLLCLAVDAGLALALIPVIGLGGAVVASAAAQLVSLLLLSRVVARRLDVGLRAIAAPSAVFVLGPLVAGLAVLVAHPLHHSPVLATTVALLAGALLVVVAVRLSPLPVLSNDDTTAISGALPTPLRAPFHGFARVVGAGR